MGRADHFCRDMITIARRKKKLSVPFCAFGTDGMPVGVTNNELGQDTGRRNGRCLVPLQDIWVSRVGRRGLR